MSHTIAVSQCQLGLLRYVFCSADTDSSQCVDKDEFHQLVSQKCFSNVWSGPEVEDKRDRIFKRIDLNDSGEIHLEEFCNAVTMEVAVLSDDIGVIDMIQFKYGLFFSSLQSLGVSEDEVQSDQDWVRVLGEVDVTDSDTLCMLIHVKSLLDCVHPSGHDVGLARTHVNMREFCHVLSISGSAVDDLQLLILVKHKLLKAIYRIIDVDGDQTISREEFVEACTLSGTSKSDAKLVCDSAFKDVTNENGEVEEGLAALRIGDFCRFLTYEPSEDHARLTPTILAFVRVRHCLLKKAFETIFGSNGVANGVDKKSEVHETPASRCSISQQAITRDDFARIMTGYGVTHDVGIRTYLLLDTNHEEKLTISDIEHMMCGDAGMSDEDFTRAAQSRASDANIFDALYSEDFKVSKSNLQGKSALTKCIAVLIDSKVFNGFIGVMIFANGIMIGYETEIIAANLEYNKLLVLMINSAFSIIFVIEVTLKLVVYRTTYFKDSFNVFDLFIAVAGAFETTTSVLSWLSDQTDDGQPSGGGSLRTVSVFRVFRLLRIVKMLRAVSFVRELRILVSSLLTGIRALSWALVLLVLFIYISAVFVCQMVGQSVDENASLDSPTAVDVWDDPRAFTKQYFGSVRKSMLTMFQVLTLESWADGLMRPIEAHFPYLWMFFVIFVCFTNLALLNLITGVFVEQTLAAAKADYAMQVEREALKRKQLIAQLTKTFSLADGDGSGSITDAEFKEMIEKDSVIAAFKKLGIPKSELPELFHLLDVEHDGTLELEEFVKGVVSLQQDIKPKDFHSLKQMVGGSGKHIITQIDKILTSVSKLNERVHAMMSRHEQVPSNSSPNGIRSKADLVNGNANGVLDNLVENLLGNHEAQLDGELGDRLQCLEETQESERVILTRMTSVQQDMNRQIQELVSANKILMDTFPQRPTNMGEIREMKSGQKKELTGCCTSLGRSF